MKQGRSIDLSRALRCACWLAAGLALLLAAPLAASAQQMIFDDGFEIGTPGRWSATQPPMIPSCNCYFSSDCNASEFCSWGILSEEDNCTFAEPKPNGVPLAGCTVDFPGPFQLGICDGICTPTNLGSPFGWIDRAELAEGIMLWGEAVLQPAAAGGGPVDPILAAAARALPMGETESTLLGREVASLLSEAADFAFYDYFCHWEAGDLSDPWIVDLSARPCRVAAGRLAVRALLAELDAPGQGAAAVAEIALHCPGERLGFGRNCPPGPEALECLARRIRAAGQFLTTPRGPAPPPLDLEAIFSR